MMTRLALFALFAMGTLLGACGPSLRLEHKADQEYEKCFAKDYDSESSANETKHCWSHWLNDHTHGQSIARIHHAKKRVEELEAGKTKKSVPNEATTRSDAPQANNSENKEESKQESVPSDEEKVSQSENDKDASSGAEGKKSDDSKEAKIIAPKLAKPIMVDSVSASRLSPCFAVCSPERESCLSECNGDDGKTGCVAACHAFFRHCMHGCQ